MTAHLKQGKGFYKNVFALMLPIVFQNLVTHMLALCDTFMVGFLGETELAAVTMANSLFFVMTLLSFGIQSGMAVLVAQYHGKRDAQAINRVMGMGLYTVVLVTLPVALLAGAFPERIMSVLTNNPDLVPAGAEYTRIIGFSYVFSGISGVYIAVQRSMENPKLGAILLTGSGLLNVFLNWLLIFGNLGAPRMGVAGAAAATLICRVLEVAAAAIYARRDRLLPIKLRILLRPGLPIGRDFAKYALPVVLNELLWSSATSLYAVVMGHMADSTPILAAYTIAGNLERVFSVAIFAAGSATAIVIGREIGSGNREQIYGKGVAFNFVCLAMGLASSMLLFAVRLWVAEPVVYPLMGLSADARGTASFMLTAIALIMPLRSVNMANIVGVLRGGGDVRFALLIDVLPLYLLTVPGAAVSGLVLGAGIGVVYAFMLSADLVKIVASVARLRSGRWINDVTRTLD